MEKNRVAGAARKAFFAFLEMLPLLLSILLLVSLFITLVPKSLYVKIFTKNTALDSIVGAILGSVSAGQPVTSYIIGGELLKAGVSLIAVTSFIISWVTVGIIQLPAECYYLGKRFGFLRNFLSFIFAIVISLLVVLCLRFV